LLNNPQKNRHIEKGTRRNKILIKRWCECPLPKFRSTALNLHKTTYPIIRQGMPDAEGTKTKRRSTTGRARTHNRRYPTTDRHETPGTKIRASPIRREEKDRAVRAQGQNAVQQPSRGTRPPRNRSQQ